MIVQRSAVEGALFFYGVSIGFHDRDFVIKVIQPFHEFPAEVFIEMLFIESKEI